MSDETSPVIQRLHRIAELQHDGLSDIYGFSGDPDPRALTTLPQPEGELDTLGPDGLGDAQLIRNGGPTPKSQTRNEVIEQTESNRLYVCEELAKGTDPDDIADALVRRLAREYVESVARREESRKQVQHYTEQRAQYHIFAVRKANYTQLRPVYDVFKVQHVDIQAFGE
jgi:hypothetical protein